MSEKQSSTQKGTSDKAEVFLIATEDLGYKKRELDGLLKQFYDSDAEILKRYAGQDEISVILADLDSAGLFFSHRIVIVDTAESLSTSELKQIEAWTKAPSPGVVLILLVAETGSKVKTRFDFVSPSHIKMLYALDQEKKPEYIRSRLAEKGGSIDPDALELFSDLVDDDSMVIASELETIFNYKKGERITLQDVETYLFHSKEESAFSIFEFLVTERLDEALASLSKLAQSSPSDLFGLIPGLQWQYRAMLSIKEKVGGAEISPDVFREHRIFMRRSQQMYQKAIRRWSARELMARISLLAEYEIRLRSTKSGVETILMQMLVYELIKGKRPSLQEPSFEFPLLAQSFPGI